MEQAEQVQQLIGALKTFGTPLGVLGLCVWGFVKYVQSQQRREESREDRMAATLNENSEWVRSTLVGVLNRNTEAMQAQAETNRAVLKAVLREKN